jgi:hypothetical protein
MRKSGTAILRRSKTRSLATRRASRLAIQLRSLARLRIISSNVGLSSGDR